VSEAEDVEQLVSVFEFPAPASTDRERTPVTSPTTHETSALTLTPRATVINTLRQYVYVAMPSFVLSFLVSTIFVDVQNHLIRPSHNVASLAGDPGHRDTIVLPIVLGAFVLVPTLCVVLEDSGRLRGVVVLGIVGLAACWGATQALGKEVFDKWILH
jgi:hypothetical protein